MSYQPGACRDAVSGLCRVLLGCCPAQLERQAPVDWEPGCPAASSGRPAPVLGQGARTEELDNEQARLSWLATTISTTNQQLGQVEIDYECPWHAERPTVVSSAVPGKSPPVTMLCTEPIHYGGNHSSRP